MSAIVLEGNSSQNIKLIIAFAEKLGIKAHKITDAQWEDHILATEIEKGMKTQTVKKEDVLKALGKK